jgi:hypothetical protein
MRSFIGYAIGAAVCFFISGYGAADATTSGYVLAGLYGVMGTLCLMTVSAIVAQEAATVTELRRYIQESAEVAEESAMQTAQKVEE